MKNFRAFSVLLSFLIGFMAIGQAQNVYTQRFLDLREKMNDPQNGYFSADGVPYHSVETLMAEAPDYGHETTSEAYSYWIWMEAMYGGISGDWSYLNNAWQLMEETAIPTDAMQPTTGDYNSSKPATYAGEYPQPSGYPAPLETGVPVGKDPVSDELTAAYGSNIYAMHWLFDCDNFYGYGNMGDGVSTPSYINTFQRGCQESVWETVPHPSWEDFSWGAGQKGGFLPLFVGDPNPAKQWRYTNAPDADARAVQAMYWAVQFAKEQGIDPASELPLAKASKMGDFVRLAMFDKYFKPLGCQSKSAHGASGYESAHYLLSWYFAWGGPLQKNNWAWRIGCSHSHFGYQNPVAAYALSQVDELKPITPNGARDWGKSMDRQVEFYTWLQSAEGAIAGGATNSYNGSYDAYPAGTATFYDMAYQEHPVYHDPGSNQWFGMQAWSMERIAELYYITNDAKTKALLDKWVAWVKSVVRLTDDGSYEIPATLKWTGQPNTWNPNNPQANNGLHVTVKDYNQDAGIAGCLAKALTYYAAGTQKHATLDDEARVLAQELLDRMWNNYYDPNGLGVAVEEERDDYKRFFEQEVFVPNGYEGTMPNGDKIKPGVMFIDIRSNYKNDPEFSVLEAAYKSGQPYKTKYHRYWAQADIALANAEYGRFFGELSTEPGDTVAVTGVQVTPSTLTLAEGAKAKLNAQVLPTNATSKAVTWSSSNTKVATVDVYGEVTAVKAGKAIITATTKEGAFTASCDVTVTEPVMYDLSITIKGQGTVLTSPIGTSFLEGTKVTLVANPADGYEFISWSGAVASSQETVTITMDSDMDVTALFEELTVEEYETINVPYTFDGAGTFKWKTSGDLSIINSWCVDNITINGVDYSNKWSNKFPAKENGYYYIEYKASHAWSHVELKGGSTKSRTIGSTVAQKGADVTLSPNPASSAVRVIGLRDAVSVEMVSTSGMKLKQVNVTNQAEVTIPVEDCGSGVCMVVITYSNGESVTKKLLIQ